MSVKACQGNSAVCQRLKVPSLGSTGSISYLVYFCIWRLFSSVNTNEDAGPGWVSRPRWCPLLVFFVEFHGSFHGSFHGTCGSFHKFHGSFHKFHGSFHKFHGSFHGTCGRFHGIPWKLPWNPVEVYSFMVYVLSIEDIYRQMMYQLCQHLIKSLHICDVVAAVGDQPSVNPIFCESHSQSEALQTPMGYYKSTKNAKHCFATEKGLEAEGRDAL